jgi:hypothetical protein
MNTPPRIPFTAFQIGDVVHRKASTEERPGMVTGIMFRPAGFTYAITWEGSDEESHHYEIELQASPVKAFAS